MFNENTDLTREQIFARDGDEKSFVNNDQRRIQENFIDTFVGKMDRYFKRYFKKKSKLEESLPIYKVSGGFGEYTTIDKMIELPLSHPIMMYKEEFCLVCHRCGIRLHKLNVEAEYTGICIKCSDMIATPTRSFINDSLMD